MLSCFDIYTLFSFDLLMGGLVCTKQKSGQSPLTTGVAAAWGETLPHR